MNDGIASPAPPDAILEVRGISLSFRGVQPSVNCRSWWRVARSAP